MGKMLTFVMLLLGLIPADGLVASSGRRLPRQLQHAPAAWMVSPPPTASVTLPTASQPARESFP